MDFAYFRLILPQQTMYCFSYLRPVVIVIVVKAEDTTGNKIVPDNVEIILHIRPLVAAINKTKAEPLLRIKPDLPRVFSYRDDISQAVGLLLVDLKHIASFKKGPVDIARLHTTLAHSLIKARVKGVNNIDLLAAPSGKPGQLNRATAHKGADFNYIALQAVECPAPKEGDQALVTDKLIERGWEFCTVLTGHLSCICPRN